MVGKPLSMAGDNGGLPGLGTSGFGAVFMLQRCCYWCCQPQGLSLHPKVSRASVSPAPAMLLPCTRLGKAVGCSQWVLLLALREVKVSLWLSTSSSLQIQPAWKEMNPEPPRTSPAAGRKAPGPFPSGEQQLEVGQGCSDGSSSAA